MRRTDILGLALLASLVCVPARAQVTSNMIRSNAVTTPKIADDAVTVDKINGADAAAIRTLLGLVIGTDVLAPNGSGASLSGVVKPSDAGTLFMAPYAAPKVTNGGFEVWPGTATSLPSGWNDHYSANAPNGVAVQRVTAATELPRTAYSGNSVAVSTTASAQYLLQSDFFTRLQPSTQYTLSWKRKIVAFTGTPSLRIVYLSNTGLSSVGTNPFTITSVDADWVSESLTFTTGPTISSLAYDGLYLGYSWAGGSGTYTVLFDNVVCVPGAVAGTYAGTTSYATLQDGTLPIAGSAGQVLQSDGTTFRAAAPTNAAISLPATVYAVVGHETNVYFDDVLRADIPYTDLNLDVTCTRGTQQAERWTYTPAVGDIGTTTLKIDAYYQGALVATKTVNLVTKADTAAAPVTRKVLVIGDSTSAGGVWLAELLNLCNFNKTSPTAGGGADNLTITPIGSLSATVNDAGGTSRTVAHDAISGWRADMYVTYDGTAGKTPISPFVSGAGQTFNFGTFLTANSLTMASSDWVLIHLGINDVFSATTDAAAGTSIATMRTNLDAMITSIKAGVSGVRIGIMLPIAPSLSQDAMGNNYASGQNRWRYKRNRDLLVESLIAAYASTAQVHLVPTNACLDTVNNMTTATAAVNSRNTTTVVRQSNGVHPANAGYWQMADCVYAFLRGQES